MAVRLNEDKELVASIREGLKRKDGYCPCRFEKTEENKCICQEFRNQIADPEFEGYCHCMLYYKSRDQKQHNSLIMKKGYNDENCFAGTAWSSKRKD